MSRLRMPPELWRALAFVAETGGYLPGVDVVHLGLGPLSLLAARGWVAVDAGGYLVTSGGLAAYWTDVGRR